MGIFHRRLGLGISLLFFVVTLTLSSHASVMGAPMMQTPNVHFTLVPASVTFTPGQFVDVTIQFDASTSSVISAQSYLDFDPALMQVVDPGTGNPTTTIAAGPIFAANGWVVAQNQVDNTTGVINFAGGKNTTTGTVVTTLASFATFRLELLSSSPSTTVDFHTISGGSDPRLTRAVFSTDFVDVTGTLTGMLLTINNSAPIAGNDLGASFTTDEDTAFSTGSVLSNNTDADPFDTLSVSALNATGTTGLVTNNLDGTFAYDPNGQFESLALGQQTTDAFSYTVADDGNPQATDTATVTITINGANDNPTAVADTGVGFTTDEDTVFTTGNVLTNDTDPDTGDVLSVSVLDTTGTQGLVTDNLNGTFSYDPNGQFDSLTAVQQTTDTFSYTASDGNGGTSTTTVTITVNGLNDDPNVVADTGAGFTTDEDTAFTTGNVLANDTDPDTGDTLSVSVLDTTGTVGLVTDNLDGTFAYDPNGQFESLALGEQATDTFGYTASDGNGGASTTTATITINGVNDNPTAVADTGVGFTTDEDSAFTTGNVLTNDTDPDASDTLSVSVLDTTGTVGLVTDNLNGTFSYDPNGQFEALNAGQQTTDTFSYTVSDGNGGTSTTTVTITIDGADEAQNVTFDFKIQGRSTANTVNWTMPFEVEFYNAGTSVLAISATPTSATSANNASSFIVATVPVGTYDVWAKGENTLAVFLTNVVVSAASTLFDLGVQQGGDAIGDTGTDPDNMVTIADYSAFQTIPFGGLTSTLTVVQQRQDHNRDGFVDIVDYAIIVGNFNQQGDLKP